jgi:hypothetical protein
MPHQIVSDARRKAGRRATARGLIMAGLVLVALVLTGVAVWLHRVMAVPPPPAIANASESGAATPAWAPLEQQVEAARQAVVAGPGQPVTMEMTAQDLTQRLSEPLTRAGVSDARIYLADGKLAAQGVFSRKGRKLHITLEAKPVVSEGTIQVKVTEALIGRAKMPARLREELQKGIDKSVRDNPPGKTGVAWQTAKIVEGRVVLQGTTVPYGR